MVAGQVQTRSTYVWIFWLAAYIIISAIAILSAPEWLVAQSLSLKDFESLNAVEKTTAITSARQVVLFASGGLLAAFTLTLTQRRDAVARASHEIDRDANWTNRYTEAVKQLGDQQAAVRYGGIYALGRIAEDSQRDRITIVEVLTAYIREESPRLEVDADILAPYPAATSIAALRTIGKLTRLKPSMNTPLSLNATNLRGASLKSTYLVNTDFSDTRLDGSNFSRADLGGSSFDGAVLTVADFFRSQLVESQFRGAVLQHANFTGANLDQSDLTNAAAAHMRLSGGRAVSATFAGADLRAAVLAGANLTTAIFRESNLEACEAQDADMTKADFRGANLSGAQFQGAIFRGADMRGITTHSTDFSGADFRGAKLDRKKADLGYIAGAKFDSHIS